MGRREFASFSVELAQAKATGNTLQGYASVFNYPIETVESYLYGTTTYIRPKAFTKTLIENRDSIQSLFNHGHDPRFGELPIGVPTEMRQDEHGLWVEVELHDGPSNEDIKAALRSGSLRSMSIAFESTQEDYNDDRTERNIRQARLFEFGPVTFPANAAATATLHSLPIPPQAEPSGSPDRSTSDEAAASETSDRLTRDKITLAHADDIRWRAEQTVDMERMKKWAQRRN